MQKKQVHNEFPFSDIPELVYKKFDCSDSMAVDKNLIGTQIKSKIDNNHRIPRRMSRSAVQFMAVAGDSEHPPAPSGHYL
jgi:hypothetical protein